MERYHISIGETYATLISDEDFVPLAEKTIRQARKELIRYIETHPSFKSSLEPVPIDETAPKIVKKMAETCDEFGIGPMASVAGTIASEVVTALVDAGADHVVFDNGGDIALNLCEPLVIGIYTGLKQTSAFGFRINTLGTPIGICTSSGTVGHSLSLGVSDASVVVSSNVALADAAATYMGNLVDSVKQTTVQHALSQTMGHGVDGAMLIVRDLVGTAGRIPDIVKADVQYDLISRGMEVF